MKIVFAFALICALALKSFAHPTYTGRSGAPTRQTCASSCHGSGGGTVQISGFPASYVAGQNYLLTIQRLSGGNIVNFNASCRVGTGSDNAGVIASGTNTATYNVSGETNGVHFTTGNVVSGTFNWTAPPVGTGTVRLYCGALQTDIDGANSTLVLVSNEALALPGMATLPIPANHAVDIAANVVLAWTAGSGATSHDVSFGTTNPPAFVINQATIGFDPVGDLTAGLTYYWRIDERNAAGATPGEVWEFTVAAPVIPDVPTNLVIHPSGNDNLLYWEPAAGANEYRIYRDIVTNIQMDGGHMIGSTVDTTFTDPGAILAAPQYFYLVTASN